MRKSNFALRQHASLLDEARKLVEAEGVALNPLIDVAVAEKLSALRVLLLGFGRYLDFLKMNLGFLMRCAGALPS